ncbi:SseB family protein [Kitasatospora acidiphila]|uniref:SseB family protein n=1 Tax=Kitasatospora acidiphila TaxID=2567942 RepID=UPI003C7730BF
MPTRGGEPLAGELGGIQWLYAFTGEEALARYAEVAGLGPEVAYLTVYGSRLLDVAVPAMGVPTGVAVDVAGPAPFLLPPVRGVVPDAVAVAVDRG